MRSIRLSPAGGGAFFPPGRPPPPPPGRPPPATSPAGHRPGHQLVLLVQFPIQYLCNLGNRVIRNSSANPYRFERLIRPQLPNHSDIRSGRVLLPCASPALPTTRRPLAATARLFPGCCGSAAGRRLPRQSILLIQRPNLFRRQIRFVTQVA